MRTNQSILCWLIYAGLLGAPHLACAANAPSQPLSELPYTPALDNSAMNREVDPCTDFYTYSCGGWQHNNPIPADQSSWSVYGKMEVQNLQYLWGILLKASQEGAAPGAGGAQKLPGDFFAACMDEASIEARGLAPLQTSLARIDALKSKDQLPALLGALHAGSTDDGFVFSFSSAQDPEDSNSEIASIFSGGLGLPDRDYYFKRDAKSVEIRTKYLKHVEKMMRYLNDDAASAAREAHVVMRLETTLAAATLTRVDKRDPHKLNHRMTVAELARLTPNFSWARYFQATGEGQDIADSYAVVNVTEPTFLRAAGHMFAANFIRDLRVYLRWHAINGAANLLPHAIADEDFDFNQRFMRGTEREPPRWRTCVAQVDNQIGEALGRLFVEKTFSAATKQQALAMLSGIQAAMKRRIESLDWMSPATKVRALQKLASMRSKIGYPERWRDYSGLSIERRDYFGNVERSAHFEHHRQLAKIGKPVDRDEWEITPPTVDAYYDPQMNDINFPAAVLLPPLFDTRIDSAPSWGNTGSTMGHELTHAFDDEGRQFDADGNLHDWWARKDALEFTHRAQCVVDQYSGYTAVDDIKVNGRLTLGENLADLGGTILAYAGWKAASSSAQLTSIDRLTPEQRFFVGMAQWACGNEKPATVRLRTATDPHAPLRDRVNGVIVNMPEFAKAFSCKAGQPMTKEPGKICTIW